MRSATKKLRFVVLAAVAALPMTAISVTADDQAAEKPPAAYSVWTANCSRSLQMSATCDSVSHACYKAYQLRSEMSNEVKTHDYVIVVAGEPDWGQVLALFQHLSAGSELKQPHQFEVYRPGCRLGWSKVDLAADVDLAKAEAMTKEGTTYSRVEVVYDLLPTDAS